MTKSWWPTLPVQNWDDLPSSLRDPRSGGFRCLKKPIKPIFMGCTTDVKKTIVQVYVHMYIYINIYICIGVHIYRRTNTYLYTYIYTHDTHVRVCVYIHMSIHTYICVCTIICVCIYIYTHTLVICYLATESYPIHRWFTYYFHGHSPCLCKKLPEIAAKTLAVQIQTLMIPSITISCSQNLAFWVSTIHFLETDFFQSWLYHVISIKNHT